METTSSNTPYCSTKVFFNHCTCTFYLKLPKNVFIVFSLKSMAKNWKPCLYEWVHPTGLWERRLAPAKLQRAEGLPDTPTLLLGLQFGIWEIQSFVA